MHENPICPLCFGQVDQKQCKWYVFGKVGMHAHGSEHPCISSVADCDTQVAAQTQRAHAERDEQQTENCSVGGGREHVGSDVVMGRGPALGLSSGLDAILNGNSCDACRQRQKTRGVGKRIERSEPAAVVLLEEADVLELAYGPRERASLLPPSTLPCIRAAQATLRQIELHRQHTGPPT